MGAIAAVRHLEEIEELVGPVLADMGLDNKALEELSANTLKGLELELDFSAVWGFYQQEIINWAEKAFTNMTDRLRWLDTFYRKVDHKIGFPAEN